MAATSTGRGFAGLADADNGAELSVRDSSERSMRLLTGEFAGRVARVSDKAAWRYITELRHKAVASSESVLRCRDCGQIAETVKAVCSCGCKLSYYRDVVDVETGAGTNESYLLAERDRLRAKGEDRVELAEMVGLKTRRVNGMIALVRQHRAAKWVDWMDRAIETGVEDA